MPRSAARVRFRRFRSRWSRRSSPPSPTTSGVEVMFLRQLDRASATARRRDRALHQRRVEERRRRARGSAQTRHADRRAARIRRRRDRAARTCRHPDRRALRLHSAHPRGARRRSITSCAKPWTYWAACRLNSTARAACPYTRRTARANSSGTGEPFVEYDVEADAAALRAACSSLVDGAVSVPVLVEDGRVDADRVERPRAVTSAPIAREGRAAASAHVRLRFAASCRASVFVRSSIGLRARTALHGWVLNGESGVEIHVEGAPAALDAFVRRARDASRRRRRASRRSTASAPTLNGFDDFDIRESAQSERPTVRISPDLPVCADCLRELFDPRRPPLSAIRTSTARTAGRATASSGPAVRSSANDDARLADVRAVRRANTTIRATGDFTRSRLRARNAGRRTLCGAGAHATAAMRRSRAAAALLRDGRIVAIKGMGGYHLACDARNAACRRGAARTEVSQGAAVCADGARSANGARARRALARGRESARVGARGRSCLGAREASPWTASRRRTASSASCCPTRRCTICSLTRARRPRS